MSPGRGVDATGARSAPAGCRGARPLSRCVASSLRPSPTATSTSRVWPTSALLCVPGDLVDAARSAACSAPARPPWAPGRASSRPACRGASEYWKVNALANRACADDLERLLEVGLGLAGEADDDVGGDRRVGHRRPHPLDDAEVALLPVRAAHRRRSTSSEPDCSGMCSWCMTFGVSAIAAITSSVKSLGCGLVNRTRSSPSTAPTARSSLPKAQPVAELDAVGVDVLPEQGDLEDALRRPAPRPRPGRRPGGGPSPCRAGSARCRTCSCCCSRR